MVRTFAILASLTTLLSILVAIFVLRTHTSSSRGEVTELVKFETQQQHGNATGHVSSSSISSGSFIVANMVKSGLASETAANHTLTDDAESVGSSGDGDSSSNESSHAQIAWCVLDVNNTYRFQHFAHASQSLFPCWSYFERMREKTPNITCGFWFRGWAPRKSRFKWQGSLMKAMGCIQTRRPPEYPRQYFRRIELLGGFVAQVDNRTTVPDIRWFDHPQDAWALRETVLQSFNLSSAPRRRPINAKLHRFNIGFIRRIPRKWRVIVNQEEIVEALQTAFPQAMITNATLDWMDLGEQAHYFASQDIIIAAHGAAMTNCAFLQPGSIVIQLYPKHYYPTFFFEPLIRQVKSHPYAWYDGNPVDPLQDHIMHPNTIVHRQVDLFPPTEEIMAIVKSAIRGAKLSGKSEG